jgi:hypothetical protein
MTVANIFLNGMHDLISSRVTIEVAKVILVSVGWVGGLAAFVYWKDKYYHIAN